MSYRASQIGARITVINEVLTAIPSWSSMILLPLATHCHIPYHLHPFHFIKCKDLVAKQHQGRDAYSTPLHCKCLQYGTALQVPTVWQGTASAYSMVLHCKCLQYSMALHCKCLQYSTARHCKCLQYSTALQVTIVQHGTASAYSTALHWKCLQYGTALQVPTVRHCTASAYRTVQHGTASAYSTALHCKYLQYSTVLEIVTFPQTDQHELKHQMLFRLGNVT